MKKINTYIIEKLHINKDIGNQTNKKRDPINWSVGDIIVATFSYSMTLVKFYEIVRRTAKSFDLRLLKYKIVKGNGIEGEAVPLEGEYEGNKIDKARINKWGSVKCDDYHCTFWNGNPVWFSHLD